MCLKSVILAPAFVSSTCKAVHAFQFVQTRDVSCARTNPPRCIYTPTGEKGRPDENEAVYVALKCRAVPVLQIVPVQYIDVPGLMHVGMNGSLHRVVRPVQNCCTNNAVFWPARRPLTLGDHPVLWKKTRRGRIPPPAGLLEPSP